MPLTIRQFAECVDVVLEHYSDKELARRLRILKRVRLELHPTQYTDEDNALTTGIDVRFGPRRIDHYRLTTYFDSSPTLASLNRQINDGLAVVAGVPAHTMSI